MNPSLPVKYHSFSLLLLLLPGALAALHPVGIIVFVKSLSVRVCIYTETAKHAAFAYACDACVAQRASKLLARLLHCADGSFDD